MRDCNLLLASTLRLRVPGIVVSCFAPASFPGFVLQSPRRVGRVGPMTAKTSLAERTHAAPAAYLA